MLTRPANSNTLASELYEFDAVGFRRSIEEWKKTIKPIQPKPIKLSDEQSDHDHEVREGWAFEGDRDV